MYDLQQVIAQNNYIAIQSMMISDRVLTAERPLPEVWPLSWLERRLRVGPPVLSEIVNGLVDIGHLESFLNLIREYLPDYEADILSKPRNQRVLRFCYLFDKHYFPLGVNNPEFGLHELLRSLPVQLLGMSFTAYHDMDMRLGYLLLLSLVPYPYSGDRRDIVDDDVPFDPLEPTTQLAGGTKWKPRKSDIDWLRELIGTLDDGGIWIAPMGFEIMKIDKHHLEIKEALDTPEVKDTIQMTLQIAEALGIKTTVKVGRSAKEKLEAGARVVLIEKVGSLVGMGLAKRIPQGGWDNKQLHYMTDNSPYSGVGEFADWALSNTGLVLLDSNYEGCVYLDEEMEPIFKWTRSNIDILTEQWPKVKMVRKKINNIVEWLEKDPEPRFGELLAYLLKNEELAPVKAEARPYDQFEHICQLEMLDMEDIYDDEEEAC